MLVQNVTDRDTCLHVQMPHPFIESCYKGMYLTFVRCCKFTNPNVKEGQTFMAQCVVELFGLDFNVAYEVWHQYTLGLWQRCDLMLVTGVFTLRNQSASCSFTRCIMFGIFTSHVRRSICYSSVCSECGTPEIIWISVA